MTWWTDLYLLLLIIMRGLTLHCLTIDYCDCSSDTGARRSINSVWETPVWPISTMTSLTHLHNALNHSYTLLPRYILWKDTHTRKHTPTYPQKHIMDYLYTYTQLTLAADFVHGSEIFPWQGGWNPGLLRGEETWTLVKKSACPVMILMTTDTE